MATMNFPINLQPVCEVPDCKNGVQMLSMKGSTAAWMRTCKRHTYKDIPEEKLETFWPPKTR
jgi:hypothetical protein